jgi:hypothetical protein
MVDDGRLSSMKKLFHSLEKDLFLDPSLESTALVFARKLETIIHI